MIKISFSTCRRLSTLLLVMMSLPLPEKKSSPTCAPDQCRLDLSNHCYKSNIYFFLFELLWCHIWRLCASVNWRISAKWGKCDARCWPFQYYSCEFLYLICFIGASQMALYFCSGVLKEEKFFKHYALNVPLYTHFTSPIRRYADIVVHRLLASSLSGYLSALSDTKKETHTHVLVSVYYVWFFLYT